MSNRKIAQSARFVSTDGLESITYLSLVRMSDDAANGQLTATFDWSANGQSVLVYWGDGNSPIEYVHTNEK